MRLKIKSIIIIGILISSALIISWNFDLGATNPNNESSESASVRANYFRNGEYGWGNIEIISEPYVGQDSNIKKSDDAKVVAEDGRIYMVWEDSNNTKGSGKDFDIFYKYFDGNIWSEIQIISEPIPGKNKNTGNSSSLDIAVENGKIYVVWGDVNSTDGAGTDYDIFYRCNLTGSKWEDVQVISEPVQGKNLNTYGGFYPSIAVENGKIYVVWQDGNNTNGAGSPETDIFFRCNLTGSGWEDIQVISEPIQGKNFNVGRSYNPSIAVENDKIYVVWFDFNNTNGAGYDADIFYKCNLTGYSWEAVQVISEPVQGKNFSIGDALKPAIAVENSKMYVVWFDFNNTNDAGFDADIFYRCNLTGSGWGDIQVISEPVLGMNSNVGGSYAPAIAVEDGEIHIVWDDNNIINGEGGDLDIFYRNLTSSGWGDIQIISEIIDGGNTNTGRSHSPDIAINFGNNYVVWSDETNISGAGTDSDIFYRHTMLFPLSLSLANVTPTLGDTSTYFNFTTVYTHEGNIVPEEIIVNINGMNYPMEEADLGDKNYLDGKNYYYNITHLNIGPNICKFSVFDGFFYTSTLLMNNPIVYNTQPNITTKNKLTAFEDTYYYKKYKYEDIDLINIGQFGNWEFTTDADWLTFNMTSAILNGTPTNDDVGEHWVNITINDTIDIDYTNYTLSVININDPPKIITQDKVHTIINMSYSIYYEAEDIDPPPIFLNWTLSTDAGPWLSITATTGWLHGTPLESDIGEYWVNISVDDGEGGSDFHNFTLIVQKTPQINFDPVITPDLDVTTVMVADLYYTNYDATDDRTKVPDLIWDWETNATWLDFLTENGVLRGSPTENDLGRYWVNISVIDGEGGLAYHNFTVTVIDSSGQPPPPPPPLRNTAPELTNGKIIPATGDTNTEFTFSVYYFDADNDAPIFILIMIDDVTYYMELKSDADLEYDGIYEIKLKLTEGEHTYYFKASDGLEIEQTDDLTIPYINKVDEKSSEDELFPWEWLILIVLFVIIIALIIVDLFVRVKMKPEDKPEKSADEKAKEKPEKISKKTSDEKPKKMSEEKFKEDSKEKHKKRSIITYFNRSQEKK